MKKSPLSLVALVSALLLWVNPAAAQAGAAQEVRPEPVKYVTIYADAEGESHFREEWVELSVKNYAPPAIPLAVSALAKARALVFLATPAGWVGDWHPAPTRQFIFILAGETEVEVSDGEVRRFQAGAVVLASDTSGKGHITRTLGTDTAVLAAVPVEAAVK